MSVRELLSNTKLLIVMYKITKNPCYLSDAKRLVYIARERLENDRTVTAVYKL